jgi:hypothetical protein
VAPASAAPASAAPAPVAPAQAPAPASSVDPRLVRLMDILDEQSLMMSTEAYVAAMNDLKSLHENPKKPQGGFTRRIKNSKKSNKSNKSKNSKKSRKCRRH